MEIRHEFKDTPKAKDLALAGSVKELLSGHYEPPSFVQWTHFYQQLARNNGMVVRGAIDHWQIAKAVKAHWGKSWLQRNGLNLQVENHWLIGLFRKHRRPFSYLQHLVCCEAIGTDFAGIKSILDTALTYPRTLPKKTYTNSKAAERREIYRSQWRRLRSHFGDSLSAIRSSQDGARVYSWLYRFDRVWYEKNRPQALLNTPSNRVDWGLRDRALVRQMLKIEYQLRFTLEGPRRSRKWFARQVGRVSWIDKKFDKLPFCKAFFVAYAESIEEYQTRRIAAAMVRLRQSPRFRDEGIATHVVERASGLSKERCRQPAREILRLDLKAWQRPSFIPSIAFTYLDRFNSSA
ncbi:MAG: TnsD family Tn7-like transposition protein [Motiliproteus sp.]|nr:TnsD family Tn7-like transposition protein [Motiliproteus sp.]